MKKKIFKVILFLILAVIAFVLAKFTYRFCFYQKLNKATQKIYDSGNYSCYYYQRGEKLDEETGEWIASYTKMGLEVKGDKIAFASYDNEANEYALLSKTYHDKNNFKDVVYVEFNDNTFQINPNLIPMEYRIRLVNYPVFDFRSYIVAGTGIPTLKQRVLFFFENLKYSIVDAINFKVDSATEDGKEYYVIGYYGNKTYINKETLLVEKVTIIDNGEEVVNNYYEIQTGNVTDEDVTIPDLSNFRQDIL